MTDALTGGIAKSSRNFNFNLGELLVGGLSAGLNFLSSRASAKQTYEYSRLLNEQQYQHQMALSNYGMQLSRELNRNAYQDTTFSMRQAGINPMLAITNGVNGMTVSGGSASSSVMPTPDMSLGESIASAFDFKRLKNETNLNKSNISVNESQENANNKTAEKTGEETDYVKEQTAQLKKFGPLEQKARINGIIANTAKDIQDIENGIKQTDSLVRLNSAKAEQALEESKSVKASRVEQEARNKYIEDNPGIYEFGQKWSDIAGAVGAIGGGLVTGAIGSYKLYKNRSKSVGFRTK